MQATFGHEGSQDRNAAPFSDHSWRKTCVAKTKVFICDAFCFVWPSVLDAAGPFFELPWTFRLV